MTGAVEGKRSVFSKKPTPEETDEFKRLVEEALANGWDEGVLAMARHTGREFPHTMKNPHRKD